MNRQQRQWVLWAGLSVAAIALAAVGCSHFTIQLNQDAYQPQQLEQLLDYRDRAISFDYDTGVQNDANDTSIFYYWNKEHTVYYEGAPTVAVYFFNTITKALRSAGLRVYDAAPPAEASQLHIVLKSVTDQRLAFQVKLVKQGRETLNKTYTVDVEPTADMNADVLRKRAYETIDKMVLTFLNDDAFKKAFFAKD